MEEHQDSGSLNTKRACLLSSWFDPKMYLTAKPAVNSVLTNTDANGAHEVLATSVCPDTFSSTPRSQPLSLVPTCPRAPQIPYPTSSSLLHLFVFSGNQNLLTSGKAQEKVGRLWPFSLSFCGDSAPRLPQIEKAFRPLIPQSLWMSLNTVPDLQLCILTLFWFRTFKTTWGKTYLKVLFRDLWREVASCSSGLASPDFYSISSHVGSENCHCQQHRECLPLCLGAHFLHPQNWNQDWKLKSVEFPLCKWRRARRCPALAR